MPAAGAHMRDYALSAPEDAVAAVDDGRGHWALDIMRESMSAETGASQTLTVADWLQRHETPAPFGRAS